MRRIALPNVCPQSNKQSNLSSVAVYVLQVYISISTPSLSQAVRTERIADHVQRPGRKDGRCVEERGERESPRMERKWKRCRVAGAPSVRAQQLGERQVARVRPAAVGRPADERRGGGRPHERQGAAAGVQHGREALPGVEGARGHVAHVHGRRDLPFRAAWVVGRVLWFYVADQIACDRQQAALVAVQPAELRDVR